MQVTHMQKKENEFLFDGSQLALLEKEVDKDIYAEYARENSEKILQMETRDLTVMYGQVVGIEKISLPIYPHTVTALIGPSGCGKTTFLRALNRMHELSKKARVTGKIFLNGEIINNSHQDPIIIRRKIGMVFQKPNPFPTMSIYDNVASGLRLVGYRKKNYLDQVVRDSLMQAALWDEVKDRLKDNAGNLSGGQQQRLCIARALAVGPEVILMDEPTSSLDPKSTTKIEELITRLKKDVTIIMVTHNMHQAMRVSDYTAFFYLGKLMEHGRTQKIFNRPSKERTQEYVSGRFS